jgi:hypothetical protein
MYIQSLFFSSKASVYSIDIRGVGGFANYTALSIAVVDYFDPSTNAVTRGYHFIGGSQGAN